MIIVFEVCMDGYLKSSGDTLQKEMCLRPLKSSGCLPRPQGCEEVDYMARSEIQLQTVWRGKLGPER